MFIDLNAIPSFATSVSLKDEEEVLLVEDVFSLEESLEVAYTEGSDISLHHVLTEEVLDGIELRTVFSIEEQLDLELPASLNHFGMTYSGDKATR